MVTEYGVTDERDTGGAREMVDPRAPRFGQGITAAGLFAGVALDLPILVYAVGAVLVTSVATGWRVDLYGIVFKNLVVPRLSPRQPESAVPHRFAKLIGAVGTALASALLLFGVTLAGYAVAVLIAIAAGLAATTGFCIGCRMYRQVSLFQRLSIV